MMIEDRHQSLKRMLETKHATRRTLLRGALALTVGGATTTITAAAAAVSATSSTLAGTSPRAARISDPLRGAPVQVLSGLLSGLNEPGGPVAARALSHLPGVDASSLSWMPWARAMMTAQAGNSLLFPLARTLERERDWNWIAPLAEDHLVLVVSPRAAKLVLPSQRLQTLTVGSFRGTFIVDRLHELGFQSIDLAPADHPNLKKLFLGRIDAWATLHSVARSLEERGQLPEGARIVTLDPTRFSMWLAASLDVDTARFAAPSAARSHLRQG